MAVTRLFIDVLVKMVLCRSALVSSIHTYVWVLCPDQGSR